MEISGYEFEGIFLDMKEVREELGVYVVLCLVKEEPHCVLDIGTAEGRIAPGQYDSSRRIPSPKGNLRHRIRTHDRRDCWEQHVHGMIGYCVRYVTDTEERISLERELQWKLEYACGTNPFEETEKA